MDRGALLRFLSYWKYVLIGLTRTTGGSLASLLGITFGVPAVSFESPGEKLAAKRLHLPSPVCHFDARLCYV